MVAINFMKCGISMGSVTCYENSGLSVFTGRYPTEPHLTTTLSSFKFLPSFGILLSAQGLAGTVKILNLYPQVSKLAI